MSFDEFAQIDARLNKNDEIWDQLMHELFFCMLEHEQNILCRIAFVNKQRSQLLSLREQVKHKND